MINIVQLKEKRRIEDATAGVLQTKSSYLQIKIEEYIDEFSDSIAADFFDNLDFESSVSEFHDRRDTNFEMNVSSQHDQFFNFFTPKKLVNFR